MAVILFCWELGEGLGHLVGLKPLIDVLRARGHEINIAVKDVSRVSAVFADDDLCLFQAPTITWRTGKTIDPVWAFPHVLHNSGFGSDSELEALVSAWRNLMNLIEPDLVVTEHSPTALVAAHALRCRRILLGTGFVCPPHQRPLPNIRFWEDSPPSTIAEDEEIIRQRLNRVLLRFSVPPLDYLGQLFAQVDETFLLTVKELDHYSSRPQPTRYWGATTRIPGEKPGWANDGRPRIFAYLKPMPKLREAFQALRALDCDVVVYGAGIDEQLRNEFSAPRMRFQARPVDIGQAAAECTAALLNGTHGATLAFLLSGKPSLHIPMYLEQRIVTALVKRMGAGGGIPRDNPGLLKPALESLLHDKVALDASRAFAERYRDFDARHAAEEMADRVEQVLGTEPRCT
jgi:UDP:flavonoid glycosyltransferase YjiC (YdhE family)